MSFITNFIYLIDTNSERADEAERKLVEAESNKAEAQKKLADVSRRLAEAEQNLATTKNDFSEMEKLLMNSTNRLAEIESKLTMAERKVSELEQKSASVGDADQNKVSSSIDGDRESVAAVDEASCDITELNQCCSQAVK